MGYMYKVEQGRVVSRQQVAIEEFDYAAFNAKQNHITVKQERFKELLYTPGLQRSIRISDLRKEEADLTLEYRRVRTKKVRMVAILERLLDIEEEIGKLL